VPRTQHGTYEYWLNQNSACRLGQPFHMLRAWGLAALDQRMRPKLDGPAEGLRAANDDIHLAAVGRTASLSLKCFPTELGFPRSLARFTTMNCIVRTAAVPIAIGLTLFIAPASGQQKYDPGVSDTEIKIGNTMPYSGPASVYGIVGKTMAAYFKKINAEGGINGRMINFISYDDSYSPPKTLEQARKLVESDEVFLIFGSVGTASSAAIQKYMNNKKVPLLFVLSGASRFNDPKNFPWVMPLFPSYQDEGRIYGKYLLQNHASDKIGILYQNDDYGKDILRGLKGGLTGKMPIVAEMPYEATDTTVDSQIVTLRASGASVFLNAATAKPAAQAIRKVAELGWKPVQLLNNLSTSIAGVLKPAGLVNSIGILSAGYIKDPADPSWHNDEAYKEWRAFMDKYYPDGDRTNGLTVSSYIYAQALVYVLRQCGTDLSRQNVMRQAASIKNLELKMLLPGITINTGPDDYAPIKQMQMRRFSGDHWEVFGPMISAGGGS
jgi:branched-chain amino acid transport system substrate-binding protein